MSEEGLQASWSFHCSGSWTNPFRFKAQKDMPRPRAQTRICPLSHTGVPGNWPPACGEGKTHPPLHSPCGVGRVHDRPLRPLLTTPIGIKYRSSSWLEVSSLWTGTLIHHSIPESGQGYAYVGDRICGLHECPTLGCMKDSDRKQGLSDVHAHVCTWLSLLRPPACLRVSLPLTLWLRDCPVRLCFLSLKGAGLARVCPLAFRSDSTPLTNRSTPALAPCNSVHLTRWPLITEKVLFDNYILHLSLAAAVP